jgi:cell division protein FtsZ
VLVHICGGNNLTLHEVQTLMMELQKHVNEDAHLLFGACSDQGLGESLTVTIVTSLGKHDGESNGHAVVTSITGTKPAPQVEPQTAAAAAAAAAVQRARAFQTQSFRPAPTINPTPIVHAPLAPQPVPVPVVVQPEPVVIQPAPAVEPPRVVTPFLPAKQVPLPEPVAEEEAYFEEQEEEELDQSEPEPPAPPTAKKHAIRDILLKQQQADAPAARADSPFSAVNRPSNGNGGPGASNGQHREPTPAPEPETAPEEDYDVPTFLRKGRK